MNFSQMRLPQARLTRFRPTETQIVNRTLGHQSSEGGEFFLGRMRVK